MSRKTVRLAIQTYLQSYGLTYVGTVYPARPVIATETAYYETLTGEVVQASQAGSVAYLVVNFTNDDRVRMADSGRGAVQDRMIHKVLIEIFFACPQGTQSLPAGYDPAIQAQLDYDDVVQSLFVAIRRNATPGGANTVWSFGEFTAGLSHSQLMPFTAAQGLAVVILGQLEVEAWEWVAGVGV
jgi:hypothetical protein